MSDTEKHPGGRPTAYDPSFCERVIELGKCGKSLEQIGAELGVTYRTLVNWRDSHEEFFHALEEAKIQEMVWWENQGQAYMLEHPGSPKLNAGLYSRSLAARFPKKYSERIRQEVTGEDGQPLVTGITLTFVKPDAKTDDENN
jgi:hypothetical protein